MTIESHLKTQVFLPRLKDRGKGVLVVYDPEKRYRSVVHSLGSEKIPVIDASEGTIQARETAFERLVEFGSQRTKLEGILIYSPRPRPQDEEQKQKDPFSVFAECGAVFPDGEGDRYENICLKAKPDHATQIRQVFADDPSPSFAVINQIGGGPGWPQLQALLGAESAREILFALLAPKPGQIEALKGAGDAWVNEAKGLFESCLGLKLLTKGKTWSSIADELWRYLLFSEFVFDLPAELPTELAGVPKAGAQAQPTVEDLCQRLRNDQRVTQTYVRRAEEIETDLRLPAACKSIPDLGKLDTFPFEERTFMARAQKALVEGDLVEASRIVEGRRDSVWKTKGEVQVQWNLIELAIQLATRCDDLLRTFPSSVKDMPSLIQHYVAHIREADKLHRGFEQAVEAFLEAEDTMRPVVQYARRNYRALVDKVQALFIRYFEEEGWPATGVASNADTFDTYVAPLLKEKGNRVALILVDALRYELGLELKNQIMEDGQVDVDPACAVLPSVTPVGMASLLPEAGTKLQILRGEGGYVPAIGEVKLPGLQARIKLLTERYGQRFQEVPLRSFVTTKISIPERVDLLVLRTSELDSQMELSPQMSTPAIPTLSKVRNALHRLKERGFLHVVIATDHGFVLNATAEAGDVCAKLAGDWQVIHDRCVLGIGTGDDATLVVSAAKAGIRGDFACFGTPRSLVPYRAGISYFHGGASLQECLVPVIRVKLEKLATKTQRDVSVTLSYRNGATKITTERPVVEVEATATDIFATEIEIIIEAHNSKGEVVGEAAPSSIVNPATHVIVLEPGKKVQVPIKMQPAAEFEGKFTVKAINPATLAVYGEGLKLETDYLG